MLPSLPAVPQPGHFRGVTAAHHAGFPQGFIYPIARLTIDRIVKEQPPATPPAGATDPRWGVTPADWIACRIDSQQRQGVS